MWSLPLFADAREDPLRSPEVLWGLGMLIAALLVGAVVISAVDKWRKRAVTAPVETDAAGVLTEYRDMYEHGEITEAEYAELRRRVAEKVKTPPPKPAAPGGAMPPVPPLPSLQPGERTTVNPPAPPNPASEPPKPPDSA